MCLYVCMQNSSTERFRTKIVMAELSIYDFIFFWGAGANKSTHNTKTTSLQEVKGVAVNLHP